MPESQLQPFLSMDDLPTFDRWVVEPQLLPQPQPLLWPRPLSSRAHSNYYRM
jgi:hypothetical protein